MVESLELRLCISWDRGYADQLPKVVVYERLVLASCCMGTLYCIHAMGKSVISSLRTFDDLGDFILIIGANANAVYCNRSQ